MKRHNFLKGALCLFMAMLCNVAWADIDADGAVVTFTNVQQNGTEYALYINDENKLMTSTQSAIELGDAAKFRATRLESGKWTFYNEAKNLYMIWRGNDSGYNSNTGVLGEYNATYCDWALYSGDGNKMGTHYMVSKRSNGTSDGSVVIMNNGSFDKYDNKVGWASNYSNLYRIDIVELAPNTMEFFYNIGDGAYAGGGWCKNWTSNNASKPNLAIAVDVNNVNGGQAEAIGVRPGQAGNATFNVNAGCGMLSLSFEAKGTANHKIAINGVEQAVGTEWKKFVINGVNASTASFILKGDNSNDCLLRNIRIVTTVLYVKAEVEGSWADNPNTHFGRVRATMDNCVSVVNLTTAHLEESTYMFYSGGNDVVDFTRDYRGFEFQGYSFGGVDLGKSFTLSDEQKASITAENPLVAKFRATEAATLFYDDDEFSYRIPAIGKTSTGRLIAVSDYRHCLDDIGMNRWGKGYRVDLVMRTSDDNGKTWSPIKTIAEGIDNSQANDCAYGDAAVAVVGEEIVVMAVAGSTQYNTGNANKISRLVRIYSSDNGETWTKTDITEKVYGHEGSLYPNVYTAFFGSGRLAVDPDYNESGNARIYGSLLTQGNGNVVLYSDDKGLNWHKLGGQVAGANEPKVEVLPSGQLLFSARRVGGRNFNVFTYTNKANNAGSWASATNGCDNGGSNGTNGDIILVNAKKSDGSIVKLLLQSQPAGGTSEWDRRDVSIWYKEITNAAYTPSTIASGWSKGLQVSNQLSAYSAMSLQEDGKIAFFFEEAPCYRDNKDWGYCMVYMPLTIEEITKNNYSTIDLTTEVTINVVLTDQLGNVYRDQLQCGLANVVATLTAKYPFITLGNKANLREVDGVYTYTNSVSFPFVVSTTSGTTAWYNIYFPSNTNENGYPVYMAAGSDNAIVKAVTESTAYGNSSYNTQNNEGMISWAIYQSAEGAFSFVLKNKKRKQYLRVLVGTLSANTEATNVQFTSNISDASAFVPSTEDHKSAFRGEYSLKVGNGYIVVGSVSNGHVTWSTNKTHPGGWVKFVEAPYFTQLFNEVNATLDMFGTGLGQYVLTDAAETAKNAMQNRGNVKLNTLNSYKTLLNGATLNMPKAGQYFRIRGISGNYIDATSLYNASTGQMSMKSAAACDYKGTIFYLDEDKHLVNYATGTCIKETSEIGAVGAAAGVWSFAESPRTGKGKYALSCTTTNNNGRHLHDNSGNRADRCSSNCGNRHDFTLEEVTELPVTIGSTGFGTLYAPVALTLPEGMKAYTGTLSVEKGENVLTLSAVEEFIPARTGVILQADKADYEFEITTADAFLENDLKGSVVSFVHNNSGYQPYTLQTSTNSPGVAFKRFVGASITGGKVYLELPSTQAAAAVRVRFAGTTEIEMPIANGQQPTAVYDLAGRRVENPTKGIYIVNGKKVVIK